MSIKKNLKILFILTSCLVSFFLPIFAQNTILNKLISDSDLEKASWSIYAYNITQDSILYSHNNNQLLIPASTLKTITTATAYYILGKDYTYKTYLQYDGEIKEGVLHGNIYITGTGDPTFGLNRQTNKATYEAIFSQMVQYIKGNGIKKIDGNIIADASVFDDSYIPPSWTWEDMGNYYGAGVSGLNIYENYYWVYLQSPTKTGNPTKFLKTVPDIPYLSIDNQVFTAESYSGDNAYIYAAPYTDKITIRGTIPSGKRQFVIKGSNPDPAYFCAYYLHTLLINSGFQVSGNPVTVKQLKQIKRYFVKKRTIIYNKTSEPLHYIITQTNHKSVNLFAETILKTIGKHVSDTMCNDLRKAAEQYITTFWSKKGINLDGFEMVDGSGLSRLNVLTTEQQVQILSQIVKDSIHFDDFYTSLPVIGVSGTVAGMCRNKPAQGKIRAKSGSLHRVKAYTGYAKNKNNDIIAFSFIANNFTCSSARIRLKFENLMNEMVK